MYECSQFIQLNESIDKVSKQYAIDHNYFGPVYHGTTSENLQSIIQNGFAVRTYLSAGKLNAYPLQDYYGGIPAPMDHLGYGIYLTTVKTIAKNFARGKNPNIQFFLDVPKIETINFGAPRTMMKWWIDNGYDEDLARTALATGDESLGHEATLKLTTHLSSKYDAVYFKGKGLYRLLDGDQVCVYDPQRIKMIDLTLSLQYEIGSSVEAINTIKMNEIGSGVIPAGTKGIIQKKTKMGDAYLNQLKSMSTDKMLQMIDKAYNDRYGSLDDSIVGISKEDYTNYWLNKYKSQIESNGEYFTVKFKKGGTFDVPKTEIKPL